VTRWRRIGDATVAFFLRGGALAVRLMKWTVRHWTPIVAVAGLAVAAAALGVAMYSVHLQRQEVRRQQEETRRQQEEARRQAEVAARRAVLSIRLGSPRRADDGIDWQRLMLHNDGDKAADSIDWHILIPKAERIEGSIGQPGDDVTVDGIVYAHHWQRHIISLRPKAEPFHLFSMRAKPEAVSRRMTILWYIRSDDGTFPGLNNDGTVKYGKIELPVTQSPPSAPAASRP
jgi:hypothetical protein